MLYWLADLSGTISVFNVFRYLTVRTGGALMTALVFVFLFGPWIIDHLRLRQGKGQPIREDGPQSHLSTKRGTPTMGGLMILSGVTVATVLWANPANPYVWIVLGVTLAFGLVGFYDDYLKVTKQSHGGFAGRLRLLLEALIAAAACFAIASLGRPPFATCLSTSIPARRWAWSASPAAASRRWPTPWSDISPTMPASPPAGSSSRAATSWAWTMRRSEVCAAAPSPWSTRTR